MFAMVPSCPKQVTHQVDQCHGGQFACSTMYYGYCFTIIDVKKCGFVSVVASGNALTSNKDCSDKLMATLTKVKRAGAFFCLNPVSYTHLTLPTKA